MYRFLLRPRWIVFSTVVAALMVAMVNLAIWQFHRYEEKRDRRTAVEQRQDLAPVPLGSVLTTGSDSAAISAAQWTIVTATGTYERSSQILIDNRSFGGVPGYHVATVLRLADGTALVVNRGFIALAEGDHPPAPPEGPVTVTGRIRPPQHRGAFGPRDPATGVLTRMVRLDVDRLAQQIDGSTLRLYVELIQQSPALASGDPSILAGPDLDLGPHLSYMGQWIIFTILAGVGWVVVVRRHARNPMSARYGDDEPTPEAIT